MHDASLAEHGGASSLREQSLLDSALAWPLNLALHGQPNLADMAGAYAVVLARNQPFVDGNEHVVFPVVVLFLALNGLRLVAGRADATLTLLAVAAGRIAEAAFARCLRERHA
ncbi:type II toxin-antitoxin system death-on-curing family toxin [Accumulibacter sp.]|uniref:type II toxin-antitoxin system death-on-curing family toxin n=1 Tax=Accumulibacter sp. TaxID=2053492 RepID=UPI0035ADC612